MQGGDAILDSKSVRNRVGLKLFTLIRARLRVNLALLELWLQKKIRHRATSQRENNTPSKYHEKWGGTVGGNLSQFTPFLGRE